MNSLTVGGNIGRRRTVGNVMRQVIVGLVLLFVVAACGGGADDQAQVASPSGPTTSSTLATDQQLQRVGDDIIVPEFSVALGDGSVFESEAVDTPLYIVFWAEW